MDKKEKIKQFIEVLSDPKEQGLDGYVNAFAANIAACVMDKFGNEEYEKANEVANNFIRLLKKS